MAVIYAAMQALLNSWQDVVAGWYTHLADILLTTLCKQHEATHHRSEHDVHHGLLQPAAVHLRENSALISGPTCTKPRKSLNAYVPGV